MGVLQRIEPIGRLGDAVDRSLPGFVGHAR